MLRELRRECLRQRENGWSEHGLLLGEAQMRWLNEVKGYLDSGRVPD